MTFSSGEHDLHARHADPSIHTYTKDMLPAQSPCSADWTGRTNGSRPWKAKRKHDRSRYLLERLERGVLGVERGALWDRPAVSAWFRGREGGSGPFVLLSTEGGLSVLSLSMSILGAGS